MEEVPEDHAYGDGDVEGVLGAGLGNLQTKVAGVHDILSDAGDFVSEDQCVAGGGILRAAGTSGFAGALARQNRGCSTRPSLQGKILQLDGAFRLLHAHDRVAFGPQPLDDGERVFAVRPIYAEFRTERRLVDLGGRGDGADAAEPDLFHGEGVGAPEGGANVVLAADVVQDQHHGAFGGGLEGFEVRPVQFAVGKFAEHGVFRQKKITFADY